VLCVKLDPSHSIISGGMQIVCPHVVSDVLILGAYAAPDSI